MVCVMLSGATEVRLGCNVQDGSFIRLAVGVGCQLRAQLELSDREPGSPPYSLSICLVSIAWWLSSKKKKIEASSLKAWAERSQNSFLLHSIDQSSPRMCLDSKGGKINHNSQWIKGTNIQRRRK